jgi:Cdc6-like AAA superfamily ATPase
MSDDFLPGLGPGEPLIPQTEQEWFAKRFVVTELFSPTEPVREADMFIGRTDQIKRVTEGILQGGQHIVIYGERGVGKTSLMNVVSERIFSDLSQVQFFKVRCLTGHDFVVIWERAFENHRWDDGADAVDDVDSTLDAHILLRLVSKFGTKARPVFVFDEFDRINDDSTRLQLAETIKLFSDEAPRVTVIVIGVARTVRALISEHESIRRAIRQIGMPRMSPEEIRDIVRVRVSRANMTIDDDGLETIAWWSRGLPAFAHL